MRERIRQRAIVKEVCKGGVFRVLSARPFFPRGDRTVFREDGETADHVVCW